MNGRRPPGNVPTGPRIGSSFATSVAVVSPASPNGDSGTLPAGPVGLSFPRARRSVTPSGGPGLGSARAGLSAVSAMQPIPVLQPDAPDRLLHRLALTAGQPSVRRGCRSSRHARAGELRGNGTQRRAGSGRPDGGGGQHRPGELHQPVWLTGCEVPRDHPVEHRRCQPGPLGELVGRPHLSDLLPGGVDERLLIPANDLGAERGGDPVRDRGVELGEPGRRVVERVLRRRATRRTSARAARTCRGGRRSWPAVRSACGGCVGSGVSVDSAGRSAPCMVTIRASPGSAGCARSGCPAAAKIRRRPRSGGAFSGPCRRRAIDSMSSSTAVENSQK